MTEKTSPIVFAIPGSEDFAGLLAGHLAAEKGEMDIHTFPDGETYLRLLSNVEDRLAVIVCTLFRPNEKFVPLYFLARNLKALGARHICLAAPYLAYMRQDKVFQPGEAVTSLYFAEMIRSFADSIITVDPHLHRRNSLSDIYAIPNEVAHAGGRISEWIKENVRQPVLIGPDSESEQWVSEVARKADAPFTVLEKVRRGDRDVSVSIPKLDEYGDYTPVLVDDIISTARTMIETVGQLKRLRMKLPVCIGVHAVFAGDSYRDLLSAGVENVVTCNTVAHVSNVIDVSDLFVSLIENLR
jgi:ribose-phosphate pyrophosphokinase